MASSPSSAHHRPWLDVVRALAAFLVLLSHVRAFVLRDAAEQPSLSFVARLFFGLSGLGHQAVVVFFVLSGFLVASSMRRTSVAGRWSLIRFGFERLSRLWPVLIPCLLTGGLLDAVGSSLFATDPNSYGRLAVTTVSPRPSFDAGTLLGNMAFLQTITVPVYGSNGPLWSLADEAWFYGLAALGYAAWRRRSTRVAALPAIALVVAATWLPIAVLTFFPAWLCGAAALACTPSETVRGRSTWLRMTLAVAAFVAVACASRLRLGASPLAADWALAIATGLVLHAIADLPCPDRPGLRPLLRLSSMSYSLYLSHVPILALLSAGLIGSVRMTVGVASTIVMLAFVAVSLAWASLLWWCFERHTQALRRRVLQLVTRQPQPSLALSVGGGPSA